MDNDSITSIAFWLAIGAGLGLLIDSFLKGMYVPKHWHQVLPAFWVLIGLHIWQKFKNDAGAFLGMITFYALAFMHGRYIEKAGILYQEYDIEINTPDPKPMIEAQVKPRKIVDLAEKDNVWQSNSIATNLLQKDMRWQQWAQGVCNCANLTQAKWAGGGRLFSRPEYEKQMKEFIVDLILKKPAKGWNKSPRVNGLEGWRYIRDLADGRKFIPLPMKES